MKIIIRVDSDDQKKIDYFREKIQGDIWIMPQGEHVKVWIVSDIGEVTELK